MKKVEPPATAAARDEALDAVRQAALRTSSSALALQRRAEDELIEAKRALEANTRELEASLALLHATLEASPDGILVADLDGNALLRNRRFDALWGVPADSAGQFDLREFAEHAKGLVRDPASFLRCVDNLRRAPEAEAFDSFELADGRIFERHAAPRWLAGRCAGTVVRWRDVTDRHRAQAALQAQALAERASRAKSEFLARMSHELRTPLNAILGFAEVLQLDAAQPLHGVQRERVGRIGAAGEHLLALIDDLLDVSRLEPAALQARQAAPDDGAAAPRAAPDAEASGRARVLYIEDDEVNRLLMAAYLDLRPQVDLATAVDGAGGIAAARARRPALVLIDRMLPDIDGIEVLRALRAEPSLRGVPCVAVSANALPEQIAEALAAGFDDYLTKPLSAEALLAGVDRWLRGAMHEGA